MKASGGHSGKTEQEKDILERQNKKRTFWKDRTTSPDFDRFGSAVHRRRASTGFPNSFLLTKNSANLIFASTSKQEAFDKLRTEAINEGRNGGAVRPQSSSFI